MKSENSLYKSEKDLKAVILGCNGGTDLAYGGGTYVATAIAHCLQNSDFEVFMISVIGLDKEQLQEVHGWDLGSKIKTIYLLNANKLPRIPHILSLKMVNGLEKYIDRIRPDIIVYNDDAPISIHKMALRQKIPTIAYIHFSYYVRERYPTFLFSTTEWHPIEATINYISIPKFIAPLEEVDSIIANSIATKNVTKSAIGNKDVKVLNPPLKTDSIHSGGKKLRIALHAARQDRSFQVHMFQEFVTRLQKSNKDLKVLVNNNKSKEVAELSRKFNSITSIRSLPKSLWKKVLGNTQYYLHFKWFEGYGVATAEAISKGALPLVLRSPFNGSYTDIANVSRYCVFNSVEEALNSLEDLESDLRNRKIIWDSLARRLEGCKIDKFCKQFRSYIK